MKINMTLEVSDEARKYIALIGDLPPEATTQDDRMALREQVIAFLQHACDLLSAGFTNAIPVGPLTVSEEDEALEAITGLRAQGYTDDAIRVWLFKQRSRFSAALARANQISRPVA